MIYNKLIANNISQRTNITVACDVLDNIHNIKINKDLNLSIDNSTNTVININNQEYQLNTSLIITTNFTQNNNEFTQSCALFNAYKLIPLNIEIICETTISIFGISTHNNIGDTKNGIYSKFIFNKVDVGLSLINRILSNKLFNKNFLYIKTNNKKNVIEICLLANFKYIDQNNVTTKEEQLLCILTYDYARSNLTIDRQTIDKKSIYNIEYPIDINNSIYCTYNLDKQQTKIKYLNYQYENESTKILAKYDNR